MLYQASLVLLEDVPNEVKIMKGLTIWVLKSFADGAHLLQTRIEWGDNTPSAFGRTGSGKPTYFLEKTRAESPTCLRPRRNQQQLLLNTCSCGMEGGRSPVRPRPPCLECLGSKFRLSLQVLASVAAREDRRKDVSKGTENGDWELKRESVPWFTFLHQPPSI